MANQLCGPAALKKSKPCPSFLRTKGCLQPGAVVDAGWCRLQGLELARSNGGIAATIQEYL